MKNKAMTYVLGGLVLVVWGLICYRVFTAAAGGDDAPVAVTAGPGKEAYNDYAVQADTAQLLLHYRDPFGEAARDTPVAPPRITAQALKPPAPVTLNWSFIKYAGFVRNPGSGKLLAMLIINGRNQMLAEGETAEQVKLLKNMKDSVKVSFRNQSHFITLNNAL